MLPSQAGLSKQVYGLGGYDSDFSDDEGTAGKSDSKSKRTKYDDALLKKPFQKDRYGKVAHSRVAADEWDREEARNWRGHLISMDAFARHKKFVNDYFLYYGGKKEDFKRLQANDKTDLDVVRENHRFLWQEEDEVDMTWEKRMAKKYYDKLFKEYCIADLSRYKENQFGFRWRVDKEVISGKGQFFCGNKRCDEKEGLKSWEVNFGYLEHGEKRNALVKLRLCAECSYKLNFHHRRKEIKPNRKRCRTEEKSEQTSSKKSKTSKRKHKKKKTDDLSPHKTDEYEEDETDKDEEREEDTDGPSESDFWKGPAPATSEKTREEEFDEYFQDMFL